ncbi:MAG: cytochrome c-type biogenesis CcmF C-terminal domain-containing protein, partial [Pseudomonadota bacterium]
ARVLYGRSATWKGREVFVQDLYAVMGDERDGAAVLRLHRNPMAPWIWIGALVMALGGGLSLSDRRTRVAAPAPKGATSPA